MWPPIVTPDARINGEYMAAAPFLQLLLILAFARYRIASLRRPSSRASKGFRPPPSLLGRLPHLLCCLSLAGVHIAMIASKDAIVVGQDGGSGVRTYYLLSTACTVVMWGVSAALVLGEQRNQRNSGRLLRLWWLLNFPIAVVNFEAAMVRLDDARRHHTRCRPVAAAHALAVPALRCPRHSALS